MKLGDIETLDNRDFLEISVISMKWHGGSVHELRSTGNSFPGVIVIGADTTPHNIHTSLWFSTATEVRTSPVRHLVAFLASFACSPFYTKV